MHRHNAYNNIAYKNNNYLSVIHYEPCVKRLVCIMYCVLFILHASNLSLSNKVALIPVYIFIDQNF